MYLYKMEGNTETNAEKEMLEDVNNISAKLEI